jgi:hypothetical protein
MLKQSALTSSEWAVCRFADWHAGDQGQALVAGLVMMDADPATDVTALDRLAL